MNVKFEQYFSTLYYTAAPISLQPESSTDFARKFMPSLFKIITG